MKKTIILALAAGAIVAALAIPGLATAKRGGVHSVAATSSVSIDQPDAHLGDTVTFTFSAPEARSPRIQVMCYQDGVLVYGEAGPASQGFMLAGGSSDWLVKGGEADCDVTLYEWDWKPVQTFVPYATTSFHAGGAR
ncbi:MAG: hypothetical protein WD557_16760 [Dehalococcoidia bacterium]